MKEIVKNLGKVEGLKLAFISSASEVEKGDKQWLKDDKDSLINLGFKVFDYTISGKSENEVREALLGIDVLFVSGGNTFYLLEQSRKCNFEKIVKELIDRNVVYIGSSAGSLLACPDIVAIKYLDDPSKGKGLESFKAFGLTDLMILPHWGHECFKERHFKSLDFIHGQGGKVILLRDNQYVFVEDDKYKIVEV